MNNNVKSISNLQ